MNANLHRTLRDAMTVADLIAELEQCDPDAIVLFACDYGDICHTQQALPVETIDEMDGTSLAESAYSRTGIALVESDDEEGTRPRAIAGADDAFVILR